MLALTRAARRRVSHPRRFVAISDGATQNAKPILKEHEASTQMSSSSTPQQSDDSFLVIGYVTKGLSDQSEFEVKVMGLTEQIRELEAFQKIIDERIAAAHRQTNKCVTPLEANTHAAAGTEKDRQKESDTSGAIFTFSMCGIWAYMIYWAFRHN